jgi:hypothetical protein
MSADKHRGIRREKQKRAKQQKRQARDQQQAAGKGGASAPVSRQSEA